MTYKHLVNKIIEKQDKIFDAINGLDTSEYDIAPLLKAEDGARLWALAAGEEKLGEAEVPSKSPDIQPLVLFADTLNVYRDIFSEHINDQIEEYEEYVKGLFQMVNEADIKPM